MSYYYQDISELRNRLLKEIENYYLQYQLEFQESQFDLLLDAAISQADRDQHYKQLG